MGTETDVHLVEMLKWRRLYVRKRAENIKLIEKYEDRLDEQAQEHEMFKSTIASILKGPSFGEMLKMGRWIKSNIYMIGDYSHFQTALVAERSHWIVDKLRELFQ